MDRVFRLNCPLVDMSPIAVEPDFTRKYLQAANYETLVKRIHKAFDRVAWEKDFVLCGAPVTQGWAVCSTSATPRSRACSMPRW